MPLFGKSLFQSVLDGIGGAEAEVETDEDSVADGLSAEIRGLNSAFVLAGIEGADRPADRHDFGYDGFAPDPVDENTEIAARMENLTAEAIAGELAIGLNPTRATLREKRRHFALANHPDRVPPAFRAHATRRMMIANQLIDQALFALG